MPVFLRNGAGHIVNVSSTAALQLAPTMAVYAATKQAVVALSEGLRLECPSGVRVNQIHRHCLLALGAVWVK